MIQLTVPREIRLVMKALPGTYAEYPAYRNLLCVKISSCGLPGSFTTRWLQELERWTLEELKVRWVAGFDDTTLDLSLIHI